ncbi:hypothetical protein [Ralstonia sp. 3PA37C10]|jgi:hypothetical protein|uniref:hypothetical protein n=1 Tax=Ralstonia sp. 3PA37C10 TaxID=2502217 RepID=UPI0010F62566|nr:hypothetical protein [Ralstonia sp. 3PA37C10]
MDIRDIYRLHQQYSQSPVTIDMGAAEDHAAQPALTYAAGAKRRWDQYKPALRTALICGAFIGLAAVVGLGLGDLYAKKGRAAAVASPVPEKVAPAVPAQAPAASTSMATTEPTSAVSQVAPTVVGGATPSAPAAAPVVAPATTPASVVQAQQPALSAAEVAHREHAPATDKTEAPPAQPVVRRVERTAPAQPVVTRPVPAPQPAAVAPRAATPPARTTEANRPSGDVKMF